MWRGSFILVQLVVWVIFDSLGHFWFHLESLDQFGKNYDNLIHLGSFEQFGLFGEFAFILVSCDSIFYFWSIL